MTTDKHNNRKENFGKLPDDLRVNPFAVPDRYFEGLTKRSLLRATLQQNMKDGLTTPKGYFDKLPQDILGRIQAEELKARIPESGMAIPDAYFEGLTAKLMDAIHEAERKDVSPPTQDVPVRRMWAKKWLPYVAASVLAVAVGIASFININSSEPDTTAANFLQTVPEQEIISYLELYAESDYMLYQVSQDTQLDDWTGEEFSEADIEAYFNNTL